jgi:hypothetical protein
MPEEAPMMATRCWSLFMAYTTEKVKLSNPCSDELGLQPRVPLFIQRQAATAVPPMSRMEPGPREPRFKVVDNGASRPTTGVPTGWRSITREVERFSR